MYLDQFIVMLVQWQGQTYKHSHTQMDNKDSREYSSVHKFVQIIMCKAHVHKYVSLCEKKHNIWIFQFMRLFILHLPSKAIPNVLNGRLFLFQLDLGYAVPFRPRQIALIFF